MASSAHDKIAKEKVQAVLNLENIFGSKFLYITFDDGPNFGSHVVLDAFKMAGRQT